MVRNHNNDKIHEVAKSGEGGGSETSFPLTLALVLTLNSFGQPD